MNNLKIGDTIWVYDVNNRHYDENRHLIERKCWQPMEIVGETRVSWITNFYGGKYPKKNGTYLTSEEEIDNWMWMRENKHKIANALHGCRDYDKVKLIAEILGYE